MEYYCLKNSSTRISRFVFGCAALGGGADYEMLDRTAMADAVNCAIEHGVNTFDTADCYGLGASESNLAEMLGTRRHDLVITTKFGIRWNPPAAGERAVTFRDISPEWAVTALENSLRRLKLDVVPIYFIHWPDGKTPVAKTMEALEKCRQQGKKRHIGVSNFSREQLQEANSVAEVAIIEGQYSLIDRQIEREAFAASQSLGIPSLCYGTLAQGFLSGKYTGVTTLPENDRRRQLPQFQGMDSERNTRILRTLTQIAAAHQATPSQIAIQWALRHPACGSILFGAKNREQVLSNISALAVGITPEEYALLNMVSNS